MTPVSRTDDDGPTVEVLIRDLTKLVHLIEQADEMVTDAQDEALRLYKYAKEGYVDGVKRLQFAIGNEIKALAQDLGNEIDGGYGEFDLTRTAREARDALDLIKLGATDRAEVEA